MATKGSVCKKNPIGKWKEEWEENSRNNVKRKAHQNADDLDPYGGEEDEFLPSN